jgi:hypothetical protein
MSSHVFDKQKWASLTIFEQMGNIGSEVGRAYSAKRRDDELSLQGAFYRGLDLFDASAQAWVGKQPGRVSEILRAREVFAASVTSGTLDPTLEAYFMQYAVAARTRQLA